MVTTSTTLGNPSEDSKSTSNQATRDLKKEGGDIDIVGNAHDGDNVESHSETGMPSGYDSETEEVELDEAIAELVSAQCRRKARPGVREDAALCDTALVAAEEVWEGAMRNYRTSITNWGALHKAGHEAWPALTEIVDVYVSRVLEKKMHYESKVIEYWRPKFMDWFLRMASPTLDLSQGKPWNSDFRSNDQMNYEFKEVDHPWAWIINPVEQAVAFVETNIATIVPAEPAWMRHVATFLIVGGSVASLSFFILATCLEVCLGAAGDSDEDEDEKVDAKKEGNKSAGSSINVKALKNKRKVGKAD